MLHNGLTLFFFVNAATTEIYTLSLHDALPILGGSGTVLFGGSGSTNDMRMLTPGMTLTLGSDRKSTRLNSSHLGNSYAVVRMKKKIINQGTIIAETAGQTIFLRTDNGWANQGM